MRSYIHAIKLLSIWTLVLLAGCAREEVEPLGEEGVYDEVYLNIRLDIDNGGTESRANRPIEDGEITVDGTVNENVINSLQLFWKENGEWRMLNLGAADLASIRNGKSIKIAFDKDDYPALEQEGIKMWLGANLSTAQAEAFMTDNGVYKLTAATWAGELAPMDSDFTDRSDIAMFCAESGTTRLVANSQDDEYSISFRLKRLVAKVLVACKADEDGYANTPNPNTTNGLDGWIKQSEVQYTLNGVNRSIYIMQQVQDGTDYDANVTDPNPNLTTYADLYNKDDERQYLASVNSDFYYRDVTNLMLNAGLYRNAVLAQDNANYTDGVYCPENTFNAVQDAGKLNDNPSAWGMITSVSIKAKFTPQKLYVEGGLFDYILNTNAADLTSSIKDAVEILRGEVEEVIDDNQVYLVTCPSEDVAKAFLKYSLRYNSFLVNEMLANNGFPDETYFYHSENNEYYTYGAVKIMLNLTDNTTTELRNYQPYYDGWGFYYTYIDNRLDSSKNGNFTFYRHGQVERNRYYILTINSFSSPGSSVGDANYVEVNTNVLPWKNGGKGEITLE